MFSWFQNLNKKEVETPHVKTEAFISSGVYQGEAKASLEVFGFKAETSASVEATFVSKPQDPNTFDVRASATQTHVTPGFGFLFPLKNLSASGQIEVDAENKTAMITGAIPSLSSATFSQKIPVNKQSDGCISTTSSFGPFFVSAQLARKSTPVNDELEVVSSTPRS